MTKPQKYISEPVVDLFGDTVSPGDVVVVVTENYSHTIVVRKGIFLGYTDCQHRWGKTVRHYKVKVKGAGWGYFVKGTDQKTTRNHPDREYRRYEREFVTTLQRNRIVRSIQSD